jgi:hypothetical protein
MADQGNGRRQDDDTRLRLQEIQNGYIKWARRVLILFSIQLVILLVQGVVVYKQVDDAEDKNARARAAAIARQDKLRDAASLGQCRRVNVLRQQLNVTEAAVYMTLDQASNSPNLKSTPEGRAIAKRYKTFARAVTYTPPTDCKAAVENPLKYQAPDPVPFYKLSESFALQLTLNPLDPPSLTP